jgi:hypothetical protein
MPQFEEPLQTDKPIPFTIMQDNACQHKTIPIFQTINPSSHPGSPERPPKLFLDVFHPSIAWILPPPGGAEGIAEFHGTGPGNHCFRFFPVIEIFIFFNSVKYNEMDLGLIGFNRPMA